MPAAILTPVAIAAMIVVLLPLSTAAPSARLIRSSEAFPSASAPDRLAAAALPLHTSPAPG